MKYYVDTNYAVRFLIKAPKDQYNKVLEFLKNLQEYNNYGIFTQITIFEICWVLKSVYHSQKYDIIDSIKSLINIPNIVVENKDLIINILNIFTHNNIDLEDCYHIEWSTTHNIDNIATFDKKLLKTWAKYKTCAKPLDTF